MSNSNNQILAAVLESNKVLTAMVQTTQSVVQPTSDNQLVTTATTSMAESYLPVVKTVAEAVKAVFQSNNLYYNNNSNNQE